MEQHLRSSWVTLPPPQHLNAAIAPCSPPARPPRRPEPPHRLARRCPHHHGARQSQQPGAATPPAATTPDPIGPPRPRGPGQTKIWRPPPEGHHPLVKETPTTILVQPSSSPTNRCTTPPRSPASTAAAEGERRADARGESPAAAATARALPGSDLRRRRGRRSRGGEGQKLAAAVPPVSPRSGDAGAGVLIYSPEILRLGILGPWIQIMIFP
jgi:hypothetical protein